MIAHIQGKLVEKKPTEIIVDCNGVGYALNVSLYTFSTLPEADFVKLYTHLIIKEDSHTLYGFVTQTEREIFKLLISVSGIGANTARIMLSSLDPKQIVNAIASGDTGTIQAIKGIGLKTAQRTILDLKDKILKLTDLQEVSVFQNNTNKDEALSALEVLGYQRKISEKIVDKILVTMPDASVETIIKQALKNL